MDFKTEQPKTIKTPRYFWHGSHKCNTPKEIVPFEIEDFSSIVFGDKKLLNKLNFPKQSLEEAKARGYLILVIKKPKKEGGSVGIPVPYVNVIESRRKRLANFINIEKNKQAEGMDYNNRYRYGFDVKSILCRELGIENTEMSLQDLQDTFLSSSKSSIICTDLKRIIHLKFEEKWNSGE